MPERRIGVIGLQGSGKTVLLTSMINHLMHHDPRRFPLGDGTVEVTHFVQELPDAGWDQFPYAKARKSLGQAAWPEKTLETSQYKCGFRWSGKRPLSGLTFYDLPGERFADLFMYDNDYANWSSESLQELGASAQFPEFEKGLRVDRISTSTEKELLDEFKLGLARLVVEDPTIVSPSTLYLNLSGEIIKFPRRFNLEDMPRELRDRHVDSIAALTRTTYYRDGSEIYYLDQDGEEVEYRDERNRLDPDLFVRSPRELTRATFHVDPDGRIHFLSKKGVPVQLGTAIQKRSQPPDFLSDYLMKRSVERRYAGISRDQQFAPLPNTFKGKSDDHARLWKKFESNYNEYQAKIVMPLFRAMKQCNALLVVVDVLHILANPQSLNTLHKLLRAMNQRFDPGRGSDWSTRWLRRLHGFFEGIVGSNHIDRIAFVVPKTDLVPEDQRPRLETLGNAFVEGSVRNADGVEARLFTCSAVDSSHVFLSQEGRLFVAYEESQVAPRHLPVGEDGRVLEGPYQMPVSRLPESPEPETWDKEYQFPYSLLPKVSMVEREPPPQSHLDEILSFLLG